MGLRPASRRPQLQSLDVVLTDTNPLAPSSDGPRAPARRNRVLTPVEGVVVAAVVVAGVVLRTWTRSHLWLDEALSVDIARLPLGDIAGALRHDGHPPLYYFLLHGWMVAFGQSDLAVRSLSAACAVTALPLGYLAGRRAGGPRAGWAFVVLLAVSPYAVRYATETRMYALVVLLVLAGYLLVANALERPAVGRLVGIALVTGALLLTHYWSLWLLVATVAVLVWRARSPFARPATVRVLVAIGVGVLLFLPWLPWMLDQRAHTGTPWAGTVRPTTMVVETLHDFGGGDFAEAVLLGWTLVALCLLGLLASRLDGWRLTLDLRTRPQVRREATVVVLTLAVAAVAGYVTRTTYATRYASVVFPLVLLVAAVGLTRLDVGMVRIVAVAVIVVLGLVGGVHNAVTDRTQAGQIAGAIEAGVRPHDLVVICPDQLGPSVHRLLPTSVTQFTYPNFASPDRVDWRDYAARNAAADPVAFADGVVQRARSSGAPSVWLVSSGSYKTLEGQCEGVAAELAKYAPVSSVVAEDGDTYFEHAGLLRFAFGT